MMGHVHHLELLGLGTIVARHLKGAGLNYLTTLEFRVCHLAELMYCTVRLDSFSKTTYSARGLTIWGGIAGVTLNTSEASFVDGL